MGRLTGTMALALSNADLAQQPRTSEMCRRCGRVSRPTYFQGSFGYVRLGVWGPLPATAEQHMAASLWMQLDVEMCRLAINSLDRKPGLWPGISSKLGWTVQDGVSDDFHCSSKLLRTSEYLDHLAQLLACSVSRLAEVASLCLPRC